MLENPSLPAEEQATQHLSLLLERREDSLKRKEGKKKNPHPVPLTKQPLMTKGGLLFHSPEGEDLIMGCEAGCWVQAANFAASTVA